MKTTMKKIEWRFSMIILCLFFILINQARGQEKIISIDAFAEKKSDARTRLSMPDLGGDQIERFRNLYYNVQPARYYNAEGIRNEGNVTYPSVIFVDPTYFSRLGADANIESNEDFSTVKLIVIDGEIATILPNFFTEKFPELEFLVFKSKPGKGTMNTASTSNLISKAFWEAHPDVVAVFNNIQLGN